MGREGHIKFLLAYQKNLTFTPVGVFCIMYVEQPRIPSFTHANWRHTLKTTQATPGTGKKTKTLTTTRQNQAPETSPYELLEPIEEKVIRMRYGLSEGDDKRLEYAVGASEDTRNRVTLMEAGNIAELDGIVPVASGANCNELNAFVQRIDLKDFA